jgi:hypothetical protein
MSMGSTRQEYMSIFYSFIDMSFARVVAIEMSSGGAGLKVGR